MKDNIKRGLAVTAFVMTGSLIAQGALVLPNLGETLVFEAEAFDVNNGANVVGGDSDAVESADSTEVSGAPIPLPAPGVPTLLTATNGYTGEIVLNWADNVQDGFSHFILKRSQHSSGPYAPVVGATPAKSAYVDSGLTTGVTYYYVLRAVNEDGLESADSTPVSATAQVFVQGDLSRPNVILVMADDMGYGDPSYINASVLQADGTAHPDQGWIQTPNMDDMAASGLRFDRFYSASAVCSPTRASCLTGRNPYRVGVPYANSGFMGADETPLSELLSAQGYTTGHFGKWHLGTMTTLRKDSNRGQVGNTAEYHSPWHFDYDVCFATESKVPTYHPYRKTSNGLALPTAYTIDPTLGYTITDANFYGTHYWTMPANPASASEGAVVPLDVVNNATNGDDSKLLTDQAIGFIQDAVHADSPFFVVLWYHTPHKPTVDPDQISGTDSSDSGKDSIEDLDEAIGNLRTALDELGVRDNTMLWLTSDNGPENGINSPNETDTARSIRSGGLRERKRSFYEGGIRVPGILEWPAAIPPAGYSTDFLSSTSDYFPTVLDYLGLSVSDQKALDGISLRPVIEGTLLERPAPIGFLIASPDDNQAWMTQDYKLVRVGSEWELFDMTLPEHELEITPLATESTISSQPQEIQDVYDTLMAEYTAWKATVDTDSVYANATTPVTTLSALVSETEGAFSVTINFSKEVYGLSADDLIIAGGTAGAVTGSGSHYTVLITPSFYGDISIRLSQGAAFATDGTPSLPSNELLVDVLNAVDLETMESTVSFDGGSHTTVDSEDLSPATGSNNFDKFDGVGEPFATTLYVRGSATSDTGPRRVRACLKFDLSGLDATPVDSAFLHLNGYSLNADYSVALNAVAAAEEWSSAPTYSLAVQGGAADGGSVSAGLDANFVRDYTLDVSEMVSAWVDGTWANHGIVLQLSDAAINNGVGFQTAGVDAPWLEVNQIPLKVVEVQISSTNEQFNLTAQGAAGPLFYLHKSENLVSNDWAVVDSERSVNGFFSLSDSITNSPYGFYKVSTESVP